MAKKKTASKSAPKPKKTNEEAVAIYEEVFVEIKRFTSLIAEQEEELREAEAAVLEAKGQYDEAKQNAANIRELRDGAKHGLFRYLAPVDGGEVLPLFDRMEPADEEKHGANSTEWRLEPIAALRLSLPSQIALVNAEIMLVGQLQDRVQARMETWHEGIAGLTPGSAAAIVDRLNDFIFERSSK
jgi:hypothetical protein